MSLTVVTTRKNKQLGMWTNSVSPLLLIGPYLNSAREIFNQQSNNEEDEFHNSMVNEH